MDLNTTPLSRIPDTFGAWDSGVPRAEKQQPKDDSHERTRKARQAIKELSGLLSEREACALICALTAAICASPWKHAEHANEATEALTDAHAVLEAAAERCA